MRQDIQRTRHFLYELYKTGSLTKRMAWRNSEHCVSSPPTSNISVIYFHNPARLPFQPGTRRKYDEAYKSVMWYITLYSTPPERIDCLTGRGNVQTERCTRRKNLETRRPTMRPVERQSECNGFVYWTRWESPITWISQLQMSVSAEETKTLMVSPQWNFPRCTCRVQAPEFLIWRLSDIFSLEV